MAVPATPSTPSTPATSTDRRAPRAGLAALLSLALAVPLVGLTGTAAGASTVTAVRGAAATPAGAVFGPQTGLPARTASLTTAPATASSEQTAVPAVDGSATSTVPTERRFGNKLPRRPEPPTTAPAPVVGSVAVLPTRPGGRGIEQGYAPTGDVVVAVGSLDQRFVEAQPAGARIVVASGVHRLAAPLHLKDGQQLLGQAGAVISGAAPLTDWAADGGAWRIDGQTQRLPVKDTGGHDVCVGGNLCQQAEDVFLDDRPLRQVASRAALVPGTFFFDYAASRIWIAEDPTGHRLETTVTDRAIASARGAVLRNLVVEKFGNTFQSGTITGRDLDISHCVVRLNHGGGIFNYGGRIVHSVIERNGQIGLGGGGHGQLVEDNEIAGNNWAGFDEGWEAGGTKFAYTEDLVVRGNWVHSNIGNGLWTDIDNIRTRYEGNLVEGNTGIGIFHEISYEAVITGNTVRRNGSRDTYFSGRVGINVTNSRGVQVLDNVVEDNVGGPVLAVQDGRGSSGAHGPWELRDLRVSGNTMKGGGYRGVWVYDDVAGRAEYYSSRGLVFDGNRYQLGDLAARRFLGGDAALGRDWEKTWAMWQALGQDRGSSLF